MLSKGEIKMITERDLKVIEYVYRHPNCITSDINVVFFQSLRVAQNRLKILCDYGALKRERCLVTNSYRYKVTDREISQLKRRKITKSNDRFVNEKDLQLYCSKNIQDIEKGLHFLGTEVPVKNGYIDILAIDKDGYICILELKNIEDDKGIIQQCLYYPEAIKADCRVITIAPGYSKNILHTLKKLKIETKIYVIDKSNKVTFHDI